MDNNVLIPYRKKDKWGFCTQDKKIVIDCIYEEVVCFIGRLAEVKLEGKWGFIDRQGNNFIPCIYDWTKNFPDGLVIANLNGKMCFLNILGEDVTLNIYDYDWIESFSEELAVIKVSGKYGFCDKQGNIRIPCMYDSAWIFDDGIAIVEINEKYCLINKIGQKITPILYDKIYDFDKDCAVVMLNEKEGLIDKTGKEIISCENNQVRNFSKGFAEIYFDGWNYFVNKNNGKKFRFSYDNYKAGYDDFPADWNGQDKEEFIRSYEMEYVNLEMLIQKYAGTLFENLGEFKQGLAWIKCGNLYGFINDQYEEIVPAKYYEVRSFSEGLASVSNKKLKEIYKHTSDDGTINIQIEGNYGYINKNGEEIIPCKYDLAFDFESGLAKVEINDLSGFIDKNGNEYWED